jgi:hypothetical protein
MQFLFYYSSGFIGGHACVLKIWLSWSTLAVCVDGEAWQLCQEALAVNEQSLRFDCVCRGFIL